MEFALANSMVPQDCNSGIEPKVRRPEYEGGQEVRLPPRSIIWQDAKFYSALYKHFVYEGFVRVGKLRK